MADSGNDAQGQKADGIKLLPQHVEDLSGSSGLNDGTIAACGFYSETDSYKIAEILGGYFSTRTAARLGPCLVFPYHDAEGRPTGYARVKPDKPRPDKRNGKGKKVRYESPAGQPNRLYIPPNTRAKLTQTTTTLLITEGEKKGAKADQEGFLCIALAGVWAWQKKRPKDEDGKGIGPRELIGDMESIAWAGRIVIIVFDSDLAENPSVLWAEWYLAEQLREAGAIVLVIRLPHGEGGVKCGLDDFLIAHGADALRKLIDVAQPPTRPERDDDRPVIVLGTDEYRVNLDAVAALSGCSHLYQRGGLLTHVVRTDRSVDTEAIIRRPDGVPMLRELPLPLLRDRLTRCARWVTRYKDKDEQIIEEPAHPPGWCVQAVHARGVWHGVRHLEAVVNHPVILPDGAILSANGYDSRSGLLVTIPHTLRVSVSDCPTKSDVVSAVDFLNDAICDFPFETPTHRAAWFAGLLTPLAWFAFTGPAPMFLIDKNVRGAGAGLLADVIALIVTGRRFATMSYTNDREELRKKITTLAVEGERLVMLDNLAGAVGNDVLDAALTTDRWKDRLLGGNRVYNGPLHLTWFATGNNVQLQADTARRVCTARIETPDERPELRSGFKYEDLRQHVRENRGRLLTAALTILRGWYASEKPRHGLPAWGSFEGWSNVVREVVVFAGLPDPGETRLKLQTGSDRDAATMTALIECMERFDRTKHGVTTAEIIDEIRNKDSKDKLLQSDLKSAVEELCGRVDGRALGYKLRHFARRNFGGKMIDKASVGGHNANRWVVVSVNFNWAKTSPSSPSSSDPADGDDGDDGDVSARQKSERHSPHRENGVPNLGNLPGKPQQTPSPTGGEVLI
jgi:hypothetical protein